MKAIMINKSNRGFTLIELMVVIAIIGLLASALMASFTEIRKKSRDTRRLQDAKAIADALIMYSLDNRGKFPATAGRGVNVSTIRNSLTPRYIQRMPSDPYFDENSAQNYRYCTADGARAFSLAIQNEVIGNWCIYPHSAMPQNGCWMRNGTPRYPFCGNN